MANRQNKRVIYANQAVAIRPTGTAPTTIGGTYLAKGVQECGIATNYNNTPYFQVGALEMYEDVEELPDVQVTISKALDGRPLLYHLATSASYTPSPTLAGRQNAQCILTLGIFSDTSDYATGTPPSIVECSGLFVSSLQYSFPVNGTFTESLTLVGNDKLWKNDANVTNTTDITRRNNLRFPLTNEFVADVPGMQAVVDISGANRTFLYTGIQRRQHLNFTPWGVYNTSKTTDANGAIKDPFCTVLPQDVDGISASGTNDKTDGQNFDAHIQSISISTNLGRNQLDELGRRGPYHRFINFPVEVTCSIQTITSSGDMNSATEGGIRSLSQAACDSQTNLRNRTIRVATCHKEVFYLGTKNKLTSVEHGGGGTDGGNVTTTYNFRNYNTLTVMAFSDPHDNTYSVDGESTPTNGLVNGWWNMDSNGATATTGTGYIPGGLYLT